MEVQRIAVEEKMRKWTEGKEYASAPLPAMHVLGAVPAAPPCGRSPSESLLEVRGRSSRRSS
eukprot:2807376-Alexandrium_andersonii.AAC.1